VVGVIQVGLAVVAVPRRCCCLTHNTTHRRKKRWNGPLQYEDKSGQLMMLPADMALLWCVWRGLVVTQRGAFCTAFV
jgi:hypothetical protein